MTYWILTFCKQLQHLEHPNCDHYYSINKTYKQFTKETLPDWLSMQKYISFLSVWPSKQFNSFILIRGPRGRINGSWGSLGPRTIAILCFSYGLDPFFHICSDFCKYVWIAIEAVDSNPSVPSRCKSDNSDENGLCQNQCYHFKSIRYIYLPFSLRNTKVPESPPLVP